MQNAPPETTQNLCGELKNYHKAEELKGDENWKPFSVLLKFLTRMGIQQLFPTMPTKHPALHKTDPKVQVSGVFCSCRTKVNRMPLVFFHMLASFGFGSSHTHPNFDMKLVEQFISDICGNDEQAISIFLHKFWCMCAMMDESICDKYISVLLPGQVEGVSIMTWYEGYCRVCLELTVEQKKRYVKARIEGGKDIWDVRYNKREQTGKIAKIWLQNSKEEFACPKKWEALKRLAAK